MSLKLVKVININSEKMDYKLCKSCSNIVLDQETHKIRCSKVNEKDDELLSPSCISICNNCQKSLAFAAYNEILIFEFCEHKMCAPCLSKFTTGFKLELCPICVQESKEIVRIF